MSLRTCLLCCLALCSTAAGQSRVARSQPPTHGTFKIGQTFNETMQRMGGKPPWGAYSFVRRTQMNEYKISLRYGDDDSASRLHPIRRLESVQITVDRPKPATELLADIPEAIELCKSGCALMTVFVAEGNYRPYIVAYAEHPTNEQSQVATLIGTHWRPSEATREWVPAIAMRWQPKLQTNAEADTQRDWLSQPIETATFTAIAPSVERQRRSNVAPQPTLELGSWKP